MISNPGFGPLPTTRPALGAPATPTATGGVPGAVYQVPTTTNAAVVLPAGGTWLFCIFGVNASTGVINNAVSSGIAAGGTQVAAAVAGVYSTGFAWRIT
jgi:hypothetical protein